MKKFKVLILLFSFLLVAVSCKSDDNESSSIDASIVGDWKYTDFHGTATSTTTFNGIDSTSIITVVGSEYEAIITLSENPNVGNGTGTLLLTASTEFNGTTIEQENIIDYDQIDSFTWELNGNQLTSPLLNLDPSLNVSESVAEVLELSDTTLRLKVNTVVNQDQGNGFTMNSEVEYYYSFERQ